MSSPRPRCLVRGSINIDDFFHLPHIVRPGETISSTSFERKPGGKGANQAYAVARAGGSVELDGCIGGDGDWIRGVLQEAGVGVQLLRTAEGEVTGRAIIQSAEDGENSIVLHAGANSHVSPTDTSPDLSTFTHLLIQNEIPLPSTLSHLTSAGRAGLTTIFNPSPMLSPSELRAFPWSDLTWLIVNEGELETLLEAFGAPLETASTTESIRERANQGLIALHKSGDFARTVSTICTLGAQGILFFQPPSRPSGRPTMGYLPAARLLQPLKDATGAGDCFAGYFVAGLMASSKGEGSERILKTCLAACAICVESAGAMESIPARSDVRERITA